MTQQTLSVGTPVYSQDGEQLGTVKEVRGSAFTVDAPRQPDYWLYEESVREAFARLSPEERLQFTQYLRQQAQQQHLDFPDLNQDGIDDRVQQDPGDLAQMTSRMRQEQPGGLGQLLGGGGGGGGGMGDMLGNPIAKAALAGIAAMAVKKMMNR